MPRFKAGEAIVVHGKRATVLWVRENANEIESMDEYIVEFEDRDRRFFMSSDLQKSSEKQAA